jgi:hypothetical protein
LPTKPGNKTFQVGPDQRLGGEVIGGGMSFAFMVLAAVMARLPLAAATMVEAMLSESGLKR